MLHAVGLVGRGPLAPAQVLAVLRVVPEDPVDGAVLFEGQDVGGDAVEEPAVVADDDGAAGETGQRVLERPQDVDVEIVGRLVEEDDVAALGQGFGQVDAVPLPARQHRALLLLVGPVEAERGAVGPGGNGPAADRDEVLAARDLLEDRLPGIEDARLVGVGDLDRLPDPDAPGVGLLRSGYHPQQGRLPGPVGADDADDRARRDADGQVVDEDPLAVGLGDTLELDDDVPEPRPGRYGQLLLFAVALEILAEEIFVGGDAGLALGLAGLGGHADPFQLPGQGALAPRLGLLLDGQPGLFLLEPGGVLPFQGMPSPRSSSRIQPATLSRK